jgi:hypothetical protein
MRHHLLADRRKVVRHPSGVHGFAFLLATYINNAYLIVSKRGVHGAISNTSPGGPGLIIGMKLRSSTCVAPN